MPRVEPRSATLDVLRAEIAVVDRDLAALPWWRLWRRLWLLDERSTLKGALALELNRLSVAMIEEHAREEASRG